MKSNIYTINNKNIMNYSAIDLCRIIMISLVVAIHTGPLTSLNGIVNYFFINYIARLAVPFFFVCNGYFCFVSLSINNFRITFVKKQILKLLWLYFIWSILYLPWIVRDYRRIQGGGYRALLNQIWTSFIFRSYQHLWYVLGAAVSIMLISVLLKRKKSLKFIGLLSGTIYIFMTLYCSYWPLFENLSVWNIQIIQTAINLYFKVFRGVLNGFTFGFFFVWLGVYISQQKHILIKQKCKIGLLFSLGCGLLESCFLLYIRNYDYEYRRFGIMNSYLIFLIPAVYFLFSLLLQIQIRELSNTREIRKVSAIIYFIHYWIIEVYEVLYNHFAACDSIFGFSIVKYVIILFVSACIAFLLTKLDKKDKFQWLKKIY